MPAALWSQPRPSLRWTCFSELGEEREPRKNLPMLWNVTFLGKNLSVVGTSLWMLHGRTLNERRCVGAWGTISTLCLGKRTERNYVALSRHSGAVIFLKGRSAGLCASFTSEDNSGEVESKSQLRKSRLSGVARNSQREGPLWQ